MDHEYIKELNVWFDLIQRDFPWRKERSAYTVLVSEIMLQQTRAITVLPYFNSWMKKFPDFKSLANANEQEVIKAWEGLGYYSRARNLRKIAITVIEEFKGIFPVEASAILSFKGIGPYTAAAISHFAFNRRVLGADGNIRKVIARFYGYHDRVDKDGEILHLLDKFLPLKDSAVPFEALIELGATICSKNPRCSLCPLQGGCISFQENLTAVIPVTKKRERIIFLSRVVFIIEYEGRILIKKEEKNLMNGLYELPFVEQEGKEGVYVSLKAIEKKFDMKLKILQHFPIVSHSFTKYKACLAPILCTPSNISSLPRGYIAVGRAEIKEYPFSAGHRKILQNFL